MAQVENVTEDEPIAANDNVPKWDADEATRARSAELVAERRDEMLKAAKVETRAAAKYTKRLHKRAAIGADWDGKSDNDNIGWPLAKALLAEGNGELLKPAMAYRRIHALANSGATLGGQGVNLTDGISLDRHVHIKANGSIAYKHIRQSTASDVDIPPTMKVASHTIDDGHITTNVVRVPVKWEGDRHVHNMFDAQDQLDFLRARLGPIVEAFELAVIDSATLGDVGNAAGIANRAGSMGAGRALVHLGLITVRDSLGEITFRDIAA